MGNAHECWTDLDGLSVHYLQAGERGEAMVLVHGGSRDEARISWEPALDGLCSRFRLFAPDLPGFGRTDQASSPCTVDYLVDYLEDFTARLGLSRFILAGLSLGGMVSLGYTLRHQESVKALILVASAGLSGEIRWRLTANLAARLPFLYRRASRFVLSHRKLLKKTLTFYLGKPCSEELCRDLERTLGDRPGGAEGWLSFLQSEVTWQGFRTSFEDQLGRLRVPTLLIHGTRDGLIPVAHSIEAYRRIPDSRLEIFTDCGHWVPRAMPERFVKAVMSFAERSEADGWPR